MKRQILILIATVSAVIALMSAMGPKRVPALVWNASKSVPIGLYQVRPAGKLEITDLVVALPPEPLATFLAAGGYLPRDVPLIKRILALPGQTVCRSGFTMVVDGIDMGSARARDHRGRGLPTWQGCRLLSKEEVFLMNWDEPASLDGRYFGPIPVAAVVGRANPIWTLEEE